MYRRTCKINASYFCDSTLGRGDVYLANNLRKVLYGRLPDCKDGVRALKQEAGLQSYIRPVVQAEKPAGPDGIR